MTVRRLLIPVLSIAVLAGLFLLVRLFSAVPTEDLSPTRALLASIGTAPLSWGYALISGVVFIAFLAWLPMQLPGWRLLYRFRHVDSAVLDNDCELCRRFYRALLDFRARNGEPRFMQRIYGRFNFFYHFHTDAVHWMNRIIREVDADSIPANMIVDSICSGHIGRVFTGCRYGGGLPSAFVKLKEAVYLLAKIDGVEIWSASSPTPICIFDRHTLRLETGQHHLHNISVILSGVENPTQKFRQLELLIPTVAKTAQDDSPMTAQMRIDALQSWLNELAHESSLAPQQNYGIDVTEITTDVRHLAASSNDTPLLALLHKLLGSHIDAMFSHDSLSIADPDIVRSTVVLCSGLGIITVVDVATAGTIHYSGESSWVHIDSGKKLSMNNACQTAQRSKHAVINRLADSGLNRWPVHGLVVFSHHEAQPELELGQAQVQCDVITLGQLPKWFASQASDDRIRFTKDDYNKIITLLDPARLHNTKIRHA